MARRSRVVVCTLGMVVFAAALSAQERYPQVQVRGRLQAQYYWLDNGQVAAAAGPTNQFFLRRARLDVRVQISDAVSVILQPTYEGPVGSTQLKDAFVNWRLTRPESATMVELRAGQEKRPFSRYELTSSTNLPSIERGAGRGDLPVTANDLFKSAGYLAHDVGAEVRLGSRPAAGTPWSLVTGVYNGQGGTTLDVNNAKSFGARATVGVSRGLNVGASVYSSDHIVTVAGTPDSAFRTTAVGVDGEWGSVGAPGLWLLAEAMYGAAPVAAKPDMFGFTAVGAYHFRQPEGSWVYALEPAFQIDVADPNTDVDDTATILIRAGLNVYLTPVAQLRFMIENQSFHTPGVESIFGLRTAMTVHW